MSIFAILGATGLTGQNIVKHLLQNPENELNLYVRSQSKLIKLFPNIQENKQVHIFEGSMNDIELVSSCLDSTKAVFSVLASNDNTPGMTIARDAAATVIAALSRLKEKNKEVKLPRVVVLSSATLNPLLYAHEPIIVHYIIYYAFWHVYQDVIGAISLYQKTIESGELEIDVRFVEPGGLTEGKGSGRVGLTRDQMSDVVSYGDLGRAMVMVGEDEGLELQHVGVLVDGEEANLAPAKLASMVLTGLAWTFVPWIMTGFQYLGVAK
jgi:hypothetical protein